MLKKTRDKERERGNTKIHQQQQRSASVGFFVLGCHMLLNFEAQSVLYLCDFFSQIDLRRGGGCERERERERFLYYFTFSLYSLSILSTESSRLTINK